MSLRLIELYPDIPWTFFCTPTGDELPEMIAHWGQLEEKLGVPIHQIHRRHPDGRVMTLYSLIDFFSALPNPQMRWCTRMLKIEPAQTFMRSVLIDGPALMYVGLRADEPERLGLYARDIPVRFPMRGWGWGVGDVWAYLAKRGVAIPRRTDCSLCVDGDALIMVRGRGLTKIRDMTPEEPFVVWSGHHWRETTAICQGIRGVVKVRLSNGLNIRVTPDHKIMTKTRGMVKASQLLTGEPLASELPSMSPYPAAALLPEAARPPLSTHPKAHNVVVFNFPKEWSWDIGVLLGYIQGDGSISGSRYPTISISMDRRDREDLLYLNRIVSSLCSSKSRVVDTDRSASSSRCVVNPPAVSSMSSVSWRVKSLAHFVLALGLDKASAPNKRRAPSSLWSASEAAVSGFISGIFSTDGCIEKTSNHGKKGVQISLSSVSELLLEDVQQLLAGLGIYSTICPYNDNREERGYSPLWCLRIAQIDHVRAFADKVYLLNNRKRLSLMERLSLRAGVSGRRRYPTVVSVVKDGEAEVFDLVNVGPERQFVANGISVSNCYHQRLIKWKFLAEEHPAIYEHGITLEDRTNHTFRNPSRDLWPAALRELRDDFLSGRKLRGEKSYRERIERGESPCRVCSL